MNKNDPVPMIPLLPIWCHTNNHAFSINDDGKVDEVLMDTPWYGRLLHSVKQIDFLAPIQDHDCDLYVKRLQKLYENAI